MLKVAIQGEQASFHDIAAHKFFEEDLDLIFCDSFSSVFESFKKDADYAVCAIENSLYGSINEVYDLLLKHHFNIVGEVYLRIEQCLIGLPGAKINDIQEVHSHPMALAQCENYLDSKLPNVQRFESHDTAGSVALVKQLGDSKVAAIASQEAAKLHGLKVLAKEIETNKQNYTRFVVLQKFASEVVGSNKTSLVFSTSHTPGALFKALGVFAKQNINLAKLESRPIVGRAWHYIFYADVEAGQQYKKLQKALAELKKQKCEVTILGSYVSAKHK